MVLGTLWLTAARVRPAHTLTPPLAMARAPGGCSVGSALDPLELRVVSQPDERSALRARRPLVQYCIRPPGRARRKPDRHGTDPSANPGTGPSVGPHFPARRTTRGSGPLRLNIPVTGRVAPTPPRRGNNPLRCCNPSADHGSRRNKMAHLPALAAAGLEWTMAATLDAEMAARLRLRHSMVSHLHTGPTTSMQHSYVVSQQYRPHQYGIPPATSSKQRTYYEAHSTHMSSLPDEPSKHSTAQAYDVMSRPALIS